MWRQLGHRAAAAGASSNSTAFCIVLQVLRWNARQCKHFMHKLAVQGLNVLHPP